LYAHCGNAAPMEKLRGQAVEQTRLSPPLRMAGW
jgi:hypothetical protein